MSGIATAVVGGAVIGAYATSQSAKTQAKAAESAAEAQAQSAQYAADVQREMFNKQVELQEPWRKAGVNALAQMEAERAGMPAAFTGQVNLSQDPGYAFRLSEGMKALERSAAARGGLLSGAQMKGIQRYGQDMASQEYANAYNRALTEYNARVNRESTGYNRLAALAGVGQTSTGQLSSAAGQLGSGLAGTYGQMGQAQAAGILGAGEARASGYLGMANSLNKALGTGLNYYQNQQLTGGGGSGDYGYGSLGTSSGYADQVAQQNALGFNW